MDEERMMKSSLRVWRRILVNLMRIGVLLGAVLITLCVVIGSPLYLGIRIVALTESYVLSAVGAFLIFWGALYLGKAILKCCDTVNGALKHFAR